MNQLPKFFTLRLARPLVTLILVLSTALAAVGQQVVDYTTTGTWVCPAGVTSVLVECWGSGGAGGAVGGNPAAAGGGAGGAYARKLVPVVPGTTYTVTVGAKKWSGTKTATAIENTGNPSWFGSVSTVYAQGGAGTAGGGDANNFDGVGASGSSANSIGDIVFAGGNGANGASVSGANGGAGGGAAGPGGVGGNGVGITGGVAASGNPTTGTGANGPANSQSGADGLNYGGGSAGGKASGTTDRNGGAGAPGFVRITIGTAPAAPTVLQAQAMSTTSINLTWTDNSSDETGFEVERSLTSGTGYTLVTITAAGATSFLDASLQAGTTYYYRVRATNAYGKSSYSSEVSQSTPAPVLYNASWRDLTNTTVNANNSLTKSGANGWNAGAAGYNVLPPNTDGFIRFTFAGGTANSYMVSLSRINSDFAQATLDYAIYANGAAVYVYEAGSLDMTINSTAPAGTVYEVRRTGSNISYVQNGTVIRTVATDPALELRVDVSINIGSLPNVQCSFDSKLDITPTITYPSGGSNNGAIASTVAGGTAPYQYVWSSGENTATITGKATGTYSVTVTDAVGRTGTRSFNLSLYNVGWTDLKLITVNADNSLTKTVTSGTWDAAAAGYNILPAGQDGHIQFTYSATTTARYVVGLSRHNADATYSTVDYSIFLLPLNEIRIYEAGVYKGTFGTAVAGDVFKLAREGMKINYYKNNTLFWSTALTYNNQDLRPDVSIYTGTIPPVLASFDQALQVLAQVQQPQFNNTGGAITLLVNGGSSPYSYNWSSGEQSSSISNKSRGTYSVTITDSNGRQINKTYMLGYSVDWIEQINTSIQPDNSIKKVVASAAWDASGASSNLLLPGANGSMEMLVNSLGNNSMMGLSGVNSASPDYNAINYCFYITTTGALSIYENGSPKGTFGNIVLGDVLRIEKVGSNLNYYRGDKLLRSTIANTNQYYLTDVSINVGSTLPISLSFDRYLGSVASIIPPGSTNADGSISSAIRGGYGSVSTSWSSGEQTASIADKPRGSYTLTLTDEVSRTFTRTYNLGYPIDWTDLQNVDLLTDNTGSLKKTGLVNTFDAGAISSNKLNANTDGWIEFIMSETGYNNSIGLSKLNSVATLAAIDYAVQISVYGVITIYELNVSRGVVGFAVKGDVIQISREGTNIVYKLNGQVIRTVSTNAALELYADVSIAVPGSKAPVVTASFAKSNQTYYAVANGNWNSSTVWSLTEGGAVVAGYPSAGDKAIIKGYTVQVSSGVSCADVDVIVTNGNTGIVIDGVSASLEVANPVVIQGANNADTANALIVRNNGSIAVQNQ